MLFWVAAAIFTFLAVFAALWPLLRSGDVAAASRAEHDVEIYRAQMLELDRDLQRGTLSAQEAESARAEIGRRLLKADQRARQAQSAAGPRASRFVRAASMAVIVVALPVLAAIFYSGLGAAGLPDLPLASRSPLGQIAANEAGGGGAAEGGLATLVARAEERLQSNPEDGRGWDVLAPIYLRTDQPEKAEQAFQNAIRLLGSAPAREAGLGEALVAKADGEVTEPAKAAFERALAQNPDYLPARFFLALNASQEGDLEDAERRWTDLVSASPEGAPWLEIANAALADARSGLGRGGADPSATAGAQAPTVALQTEGGASGRNADAAAVAEIAAMPEEERAVLIEGMVTRLASRLEAQPDDLEGWKMLIRSYAMLGRDEEARAALRTAETHFADDPRALGELRSFVPGLEGQ